MSTEVKLKRRIDRLVDAGSSPYDEGGFEARDVRGLHGAAMRARYYTKQSALTARDRNRYELAWRHAMAALRLVAQDDVVYNLTTELLEGGR